MPQVSGFSKLSKNEKIEWLTQHYFKSPQKAKELLQLYWNKDEKLQRLHDEFSENTITNYYLPFGIAPNFKIDEKNYTIPMVIEESSVIAAASNAAKFWQNKGGFKTKILGTIKSGQIHLMYEGETALLQKHFKTVKPDLIKSVAHLTQKMEKRGGGLLDIELIDKTQSLDNYYQLDCSFETVDAMGANFINSCLEEIADTFEVIINKQADFKEHQINIVMAILSNYVTDCRVKAEVSCSIDELFEEEEKSRIFAKKFVEAVQIAKVEPKRAVTHNKGIMNGIDAVTIATGNDFRAVEACVHAYAARKGQYEGLTSAEIKDGMFRFWIEIPLAVGTVGGLTSLHPMVKLALEMLGFPSAKNLMRIIAVTGLAQNFGALKSLVTTGIQQGHMKMHLMNILNQFETSATERKETLRYFKNHVVSYSAVAQYLEKLKGKS